MTTQRPTLFDLHDGKPFFRNLPIQRYAVPLRGRTFLIDALADAADLLDQPDFAKRFIEDDVGPYGLELWDSSIMLAEHLLQAEATDVNVAVELGCGLGLVSIALASFGWKMTATDNEPTALAFARHNAQLNAVNSIKFETLDWHHPPKERHYDRVLAADVLYQLVDQTPLIDCFRALLSPTGVAYVADPNRRIADGFETMARSSGFDVEVFDAEAARPDAKQTKGRIYRLRLDEGG
ncbi:MAG: methyltransferase domain-containing protein [Planctomycetes bacterium]|nr:methyltransferase domain-containing protein [Planctomycetota bacterium]